MSLVFEHLRKQYGNNVAIDDLYTLAKPKLDKLQKPVNVHFTTEGSEVLAERVAASIQESLGKK